MFVHSEGNHHPKCMVWLKRGGLKELTVYKAVVGSGTAEKALAKQMQSLKAAGIFPQCNSKSPQLLSQQGYYKIVYKGF